MFRAKVVSDPRMAGILAITLQVANGACFLEVRMQHSNSFS